MKQIVINFYLDDKEETNITSFNELLANPFSVGDEINLNVDWIHAIEWANKSDHVKNIIGTKQKVKEEKFNLRRVKIIRDFKSIHFDELNEPKLIIDYYCDFI